MSNTPFVHLHCHTDYSLLDGACEISQLMEVAKQQRAPAIALTDHGNLFGAVEFYNKANASGVHPVIGCEMYVAQKGHTDKSETNRYNHLVLLCENQEGYRNLIKLVSTGYLDGFYYKPRIDKDLLARHSKGLICLSACLRGDVNEALVDGKYDEARKLAYEYQDMFGRENFFLEIQDHGLEKDRKLIPEARKLALDTGMPLVATNDAHYLTNAHARSHEIMLCIQTGKTISDAGRMRFDTEAFHVKTRVEMEALFGDTPRALDLPFEIAQRCQLKLEKVKEPFPRFPIPPDHTPDSYFAWVARQGFETRLPRLEAMAARGALKHSIEQYRERLELEIKLIQQMKFSGYFLIVWDFIRYAREAKIPVGPGRGSAAGSLVGFAMRITDVDPLQYGLLFERFLNPERISMPDIDIDFCTRGRGQVIQYVTEKYGREQVAQIITFGTLGAKAAIKDVARVLELSFAESDKLTKLVPGVLNIGLKDAIDQEPGLNEAAKKDPRVAEVLDVALRLEGMARNASVHAAGVVISPEPLANIVPLYKTAKDEIVTQYDMNGLEKLGLLKMDFLGLTTLTIIEDATKLIERYRGVKIAIDELPLDDPKTYELFGKAYTSGVFQFESPGMRDVLRRYQPSRVEDLCALNALYRPGPLKGGVVDDFINRKHGRSPVVYDPPDLKEILEETYGVMLYQEQVMQVANKMAGYSLGEADMLRRAMGKKKVEEMAQQRERFLSGAKAKGYAAKKAEKIFDLMAQFAEYGFNKSHSAAYGYLAYITAYLKANYPVEFMSALLTSETGNTAKVVKYINECRDMQIRVLAPDVNHSDLDFTPDGDAIRFGLGAVKNVGANAVEAIVAARRDGGPFASIFKFCERVDMSQVNRRVIESLVKAGALDSLGSTRSQTMAALDSAIETGVRAQRDRLSGQSGLFGGLLEAENPEPALPNVPDWTPREKLAGEKEVLGYYVSGHPLDEFQDRIPDIRTHTTANLEGLARATEVKLCALLTQIQRKRNRDGKPWAAFQIEDREGTIEGVAFTTVYEGLQQFLQEDRAMLIRATVLPEESGPPKLSVQDLVPLELARVDLATMVAIKVKVGANGLDRATELQSLFTRKPGDAHVRLRLEKRQDFSVTLDVAARVRPDREFRAEVERICGTDAFEPI
ncbi:MAG: DNA polymerase III subunit alpha [Bryobacteraceae bacterium]|nr:DNA polymerase III subunit alpha [Bryobacteraceae bacterium]